jgi:hypothetical protein
LALQRRSHDQPTHSSSQYTSTNTAGGSVQPSRNASAGFRARFRARTI